MARIHVVQKARKAQGNCEHCHKPIDVGMAYKWAQPVPYRGARGIKRIRHYACPGWRPSELTFSKMQSIMELQEMYTDQIADATPDTADDLVAEWAQTVTDVADEYQQSHDNMPEGLQQGSVGEQLEEKATNLAEWASEIESIEIPNAENYECEDCMTCDGDGTIECTVCSGLGIDIATGDTNETNDNDCEPCPECGGATTVPCPDCDGSGNTEELTDNGLSDWRDDFAEAAANVIDNCPVE